MGWDGSESENKKGRKNKNIKEATYLMTLGMCIFQCFAFFFNVLSPLNTIKNNL